MNVRLHLLGTPHAVDEIGQRHDLEFDRPTALLALLALRADWVRRHELAALLRTDADDALARAYLRKIVHRARRQPWATSVDIAPGRLRWRVATDVASFRDAIARGDDAAALATYRGPLLDGIDLPRIETLRATFEAERTELAAAWRTAALRHARALESAGDFTAATQLLTNLIGADPLDEDAVEATLRVHLAAARPRDAWRAFEAFRDALAHELAAAPLATTVALAERARPTKPDTPPTRTPKHPTTPHAGATGIRGAPPLQAPLVGRDALLTRVLGYWTRGDGRWVTLAGLGGSGKTRLALELAAHAAAERPTAFVVAAGHHDLDDLATAIAAALDHPIDGRTPPHAALTETWRERPLQLVLDDLEPDLAPTIEAWLLASPHVRILTTARSPFDLPGEWLVDVGGLEAPPENASEPATYDAVRFFLTCTERRAAEPITDHAGLTAVAELCRRVDGLPLALELAAAWTRAAPIDTLLDRMHRDVGTLTADTPDLPARHRDLVTVLDATLDLLDPTDRAALDALTAFATPFTAAAAADVASADLACLLRFVNLGILARHHGPTYRLHPLIHDVTSSRQTERHRTERRRDVRRYAASRATAATAALLHHDEAGALRALAPEAALLKAAWDDALALGDAPTTTALEVCLYLVWDARAAYHEGYEAFRRAAAHPWPDAALARRLDARAGYFALRLGRSDDAHHHLERARAGADTADAGFAIHNLGILDLLAGRYDAARARFTDAYARYEALDDPWGMSRAAHNLAAVGHFTDDLDAAVTWGRRALAQSRALGNGRGIASAANNLGSVLEARGELHDAEIAYREALTQATAIDDPRGEAAAWTNLGHLAERRGDDAAAAAAYERSLHLKRAIGDPLALAVTLANLADVHVRRGEAPRARAMVREALRIAADAGSDVYLARALLTHARERAIAGDEREAQRTFDALAAFSAAEAWVRSEAAAARIHSTTRAEGITAPDDPALVHAAARAITDATVPTTHDPPTPETATAAVRAAVARALASD